jgi:hypothetical protein
MNAALSIPPGGRPPCRRQADARRDEFDIKGLFESDARHLLMAARRAGDPRTHAALIADRSVTRADWAQRPARTTKLGGGEVA